MILKKIYDEETKTQKIWYDSSMIYYTEMVENESENCGNLFVVFKTIIKSYIFLAIIENLFVPTKSFPDFSSLKSLLSKLFSIK